MRINIKNSYYFRQKIQLSLRELELIFEGGEIYNYRDRHLLLIVDNIY
jgi:hypothetical protein